MGKEGIRNSRGQVTIFVILAILVVAGVLIYFALRDSVSVGKVPTEMEPVYDYYISCLENSVERGIDLMGEQGGYIETPDFERGSIYMPQSSQLDFFGQGVPYWLYVSGNNILREQVPTESDMESQLESYIENEMSSCDFSDFEMTGYDIYYGDSPSIDVEINDLSVDVSIRNPFYIYYADDSVVVTSHDFSVDSKLGKFYQMALQTFNYEKSTMFLEDYALDVLRLYAPVSGSEVTCSPKIFVDSEIQETLVDGFVSNVAALRLSGDYYDLASKENEYFVVNTGFDSDENVNFMYLEDWPTRIEIYGDKVVEPVGLQEGLGILGFCYVPYHLVYDISFPVLIQFYDEEELFQFPVVVVISKNQAREAVEVDGTTSVESEVCQYKNQAVTVRTYDLDLNPVEARVQFKCLDSLCNIGETEVEGGSAVLTDLFPSCVNGFIIASAEGYADTKYQISTNSDDSAEIILLKKYNLSLDLGNVDSALVSFSGESYSATAMYPDIQSLELVEDYYNVTVYVYEDSSLTFPAINKEICVDVTDGAIEGFFGVTSEECYDINVPEMEVSNAVVGGGTTSVYFTEGELSTFSILNVDATDFGSPKDLEGLQENYELIETEDVSVTLS